MKNRPGKALSVRWLLLVFFVNVCAQDPNSQTDSYFEQSDTTGADATEPQDDSIVTYKDGVAHIKLEGDFSYMITNGFGVVVETGRGRHSLSVGSSLRPGTYSLSVKSTLGLFTESIVIR